MNFVKKICAITMVRNDEFYLRKWVEYYGAQLGRDNLRIYFDGTVFYSGIVATYTHYAAALGIFYLFAWFFAERKPVRCVTFIGEISFEIYLYHYMFTVGPVSLFSATSFWVVNCIMTFSITLIIATVTHDLANSLEKKVFAEMR